MFPVPTSINCHRFSGLKTSHIHSLIIWGSFFKAKMLAELVPSGKKAEQVLSVFQLLEATCLFFSPGGSSLLRQGSTLQLLFSSSPSFSNLLPMKRLMVTFRVDPVY